MDSSKIPTMDGKGFSPGRNYMLARRLWQMLEGPTPAVWMFSIPTPSSSARTLSLSSDSVIDMVMDNLLVGVRVGMSFLSCDCFGMDGEEDTCGIPLLHESNAAVSVL